MDICISLKTSMSTSHLGTEISRWITFRCVKNNCKLSPTQLPGVAPMQWRNLDHLMFSDHDWWPFYSDWSVVVFECSKVELDCDPCVGLVNAMYVCSSAFIFLACMVWQFSGTATRVNTIDSPSDVRLLAKLALGVHIDVDLCLTSSTFRLQQFVWKRSFVTTSLTSYAHALHFNTIKCLKESRNSKVELFFLLYSHFKILIITFAAYLRWFSALKINYCCALLWLTIWRQQKCKNHYDQNTDLLFLTLQPVCCNNH